MIVPAFRTPNPRVERRRKLAAIQRDCEAKKAELQGAVPPGVWRNPKFYLGVIVVFVILGSLLFRVSKEAAGRGLDPPHLQALRNLDVLAQALGRYRFHVGAYPTAEQGLYALVRDPAAPGWNGPYISHLGDDPWKTPFGYAPPVDGGVPRLWSSGPDKLAGTADDLRPDPARFNPGTDWTNGWVSAEERKVTFRILNELPPGEVVPLEALFPPEDDATE